MKKILIINDYFIGGGAEQLMHNMIDFLSKNKSYELYVLTEYYDYTKASLPINVKHYCIKKNKRYTLLNRLINKVKEKIYLFFCSLHNFDVVISMKEGPCMKWCSKMNAKKKLGFVLVDFQQYHWTSYTFHNSLKEELECMKMLTYTICISESIKDSLIKTFGNPMNITIKYPPINEKKCMTLAFDHINLQYKEMNDITIFISVGRLVESKGYSRLLNIAFKLKKENYKFEIWIIGDGENMEKYLSFINTFELFDVVKLLGRKSNPYKYMKLADWYICSSLTEGFSTIAQESIAIGLPVISTSCSGAYELIGDNIYGILTENTEESLYLNMKKVLDNPELQLHYTKMAKKRLDFISLKKRMEEIEQLF